MVLTYDNPTLMISHSNDTLLSYLSYDIVIFKILFLQAVRMWANCKLVIIIKSTKKKQNGGLVT